MNRFLAVVAILLLVTWMACNRREQHSLSMQVKNYHIQTISDTRKAVLALAGAIKRGRDQEEIWHLFKESRLAYKKTEFFSEYYHSFTVKTINGAPIPEIDMDDQHRVTMPTGFQVIEGYIFPAFNKENKPALLQEISVLESNLKHLEVLARGNYPTNEHVFDALRLQVYRVITMGISGFDAPLSQNSINEATASFSSLNKVLDIYADTLSKFNPSLYKNTRDLLVRSQHYLNKNGDFNKFDRTEFITSYANPLSRSLLNLSKFAGIEPFKELRPLRATAETMFDANAFNADYYTSSFEMHSNPKKVSLGKMLFFDPVLSGNGRRSCASCHQPQKAFADGIAKNTNVGGNALLLRNTPTILNAGLQPTLFYDTRVTYLEDQAAEVISNSEEMHGSMENAVAALKRSTAYQGLFNSAFKNAREPLSAITIKNAIACYVRSLNSLNSAFDRYMRGDKGQLNLNEVNGFNLFMGKAKCGTCHFMPLFSGNVPPSFQFMETEIIGVPVSASKNQIDSYTVIYNLRNFYMHKNSFKSTTLMNISLTSPFMHNGAYSTLNEVVDFYDNGGGVGLGFKLENQTLPFDKLHLTSKEKQDVVAFLKKLTDTSSFQNKPLTLPALEPGKPKRNIALNY